MVGEDKMSSQVEQDILRKIEIERNIIQGSTVLKKKTDNVQVIRKCDTNIREARQNLEYLEETLQKLQLGARSFSNATATDSRNGTVGEHDIRSRAGYAQLSTMNPDEIIYSRLDLIKYNCPSLAQKIQYMLQQLEFKLQVEKQYQEANNKLTKLYQIDGDERSSSAAEGGAMESKHRIQLLTKALKKYQKINVDLDPSHDRDDYVLSNNRLKGRDKQLSGVLTIGITAVRDVDHIQSPLFARNPESYIAIKVDDAVKARTRPTRNDRWHEEFNINVGKGNEVEITVYDKVNNTLTPVAVMWLLLSDIVEEMRKKKVGKQSNQNGWVNATQLDNPSSSIANTDTTLTRKFSAGNSNDETKSNALAGTPEENTEIPLTSNGWFVMEPSGQILLTLGFQKTSQQQRQNIVGGLHRHGAIRNRKEEVFEQHGHYFIQKSFYNIMCCSYCGDFLRYTGFQCQNCKFLCHKKCYHNVITKCIAKSSTEIDPAEAKFNHRIPHRFEYFVNRGTKWCCHCGYILPWGKQKVRKCSECGVMCHANCAHLVPDFCGMSMEMANQVLKTIQDTQKQKQGKQKQSASAISQPHHPGTKKIPSIKPGESFVAGTNNEYLDENINTSHAIADREARSKDKLNDYLNDNQAYLDFTNNVKDNMDLENENYQDHARKNWRHSNQINPYEIGYDMIEANTDESKREEIERLKLQRDLIEQEMRDDMEKSQVGELHDDIDVHGLDLDTTQTDKAITLEPVSTNPFKAMDLTKIQSSPERLKDEQQTNKRNTGEYLRHSKTDLDASVQKLHGKGKRKGNKRLKVSLDNFILLKVLGKGNFGKVILSKSKNTGKLCAIKILKKDSIIQNHDIQSARAEKKVFLLATKTKHPFLTNLYCSFQTENRIYFAMEFIGGGDLMWHVQNQRLSVRRAKFYAAEVLLALKYFHDNGVIYRDLKLENILLTPQGHIKIADYGLCKDEMWYGSKTSTFCGTPEFMAPEILKDQEYTRAVDWWAFGVLLYQMLLCQSPFSGDDEDEVFNAILTDEPLYPIDMSGDIVQIFQGLLTKDAELRLGAGPRDALEIMEEPFFRNINFDDVLNLRVQPPYIPEIKSPEDTSYFEQEFTSAPPTLTPLPSVLSTNQQEEFRGFSFMPEDLEL